MWATSFNQTSEVFRHETEILIVIIFGEFPKLTNQFVKIIIKISLGLMLNVMIVSERVSLSYPKPGEKNERTCNRFYQEIKNLCNYDQENYKILIK